MIETERKSSPPTILLKGVDADDTYYYWRWLDGSEKAGIFQIEQNVRRQLLAELNSALPNPVLGESQWSALHRSFNGAFTDRELEEDLSQRMGRSFLSPSLIEGLIRRQAAGQVGGPDVKPILRIHPSPETAHVPWEILILDHSSTRRRLVEVADVRIEVPAPIRLSRDRYRGGNGTSARRVETPVSVAYVLDPLAGMPPVFESIEDVPRLADHLRSAASTELIVGNPESPTEMVRQQFDRFKFSSVLQERPSRLFYVGHATSSRASSVGPEGSSLHLSDSPGTPGYGPVVGGYRVLTALDLLAGPGMPDDFERRGRDFWPMPKRVAIIACDSGSDHRHAETFGIAVAMILNGAEIVTGTRWDLPTDAAIELLTDSAVVGDGPLSRLIVDIDRIHASANLFGSMNSWQIQRLRRWERSGLASESPLFWASIVTYFAPPVSPDHNFELDLSDERLELLGLPVAQLRRFRVPK